MTADEAREWFETRMAEVRAEARAAMPARVAALDDETRLAVVVWAYEALQKNIAEGGTFRFLVYNRLGFEGSAYAPLYEAGGMALNDMGLQA